MKRLALTSVLSLSIAATMPTGVRADLKDVIIGVGVGALASEAIRREKAKKNKQKKKVYRSSPSKPATLNSQYTRDEKRNIQASLNSLGYNVGTVDGSLGPRSRSAISQFQVARGEAGTGQLTRPQFVALMGAAGNPAAAFVVDRRLSRDEVVLMQTGLQRLGFYTSRIDGSAGPGTRRAREGFLWSQGQNPATITQVQSAVLAAQAAGLPVPPYLMQEAQLQYQQANAPAPQPFAPVPQQPQTFAVGTPAPQSGQTLFGTPQQPQQQPQGAALFGTPQAVPQQQPQTQPLFGSPAPQPAAPQTAATGGQAINPLFAPQPQQPAQGAQGGQQLFGAQPQQPAQGGQQLFGTTPQAPAQQAPAQGGSLDIFAGATPAPAPAPTPVAPAPAAPQVVAAPAPAPAPAAPAQSAAAPVATQATAGQAEQNGTAAFAAQPSQSINPLRQVLGIIAPSEDQ
ncbi:MAG: peptidoglycan-binding domain-containing protein [Pseudomonadota bacterium]